MKHGICLTAIYQKAVYNSNLLVQLIQNVRKQKLFQCVEIYFEGSEEEERKINMTLTENGITAVYPGGLPMKRDGIDISAKSNLMRKESVDCVKHHIDHAIRIGCSKIVVVSGPAWHEQNCEQEIVEQTRKSLKELDEYCRGTSLQISLEPFPVKTAPCLAIGETKLVHSIFQNSNFQNVGITFDTSHVAQLGEEVEKSFQLLRPWIHHLHLANCVIKDQTNPLYGDQHPIFLQKDGEFGLESIRSFYQKLLLQGMLDPVDICSLEIISRGNEDKYYMETCREAEYIWK